MFKSLFNLLNVSKKHWNTTDTDIIETGYDKEDQKLYVCVYKDKSENKTCKFYDKDLLISTLQFNKGQLDGIQEIYKQKFDTNNFYYRNPTSEIIIKSSWDCVKGECTQISKIDNFCNLYKFNPYNNTKITDKKGISVYDYPGWFDPDSYPEECTDFIEEYTNNAWKNSKSQNFKVRL
jgi:hypothetical protein